MDIMIILIIGLAIALGGTSVIQAVKFGRVHDARIQKDREQKAALKLEQQAGESEQRLKEMEYRHRLEDEQRDYAAGILRDEDARIRSNPGGYAEEQMMLTYTSAGYTQAGRDRERAETSLEKISAKIDAVESTIKLAPALAVSLFMVWLITVLANTVITWLVMSAIMGLWAVIVAPVLVLAPTVCMQIIRSCADKRGSSEGSDAAFARAVVMGLAVIVVVGGVLFTNTGERAGYLFDKKISKLEIQLEFMEAEEVPDPFQVSMLKMQIDSVRASRDKAEKLFKGTLPITLALECLCAYFLADFTVRRSLRKLQNARKKEEIAVNRATERESELAMAARNNVIARLAGLGLYSGNMMQLLGLDVEGGAGHDLPPEDVPPAPDIDFTEPDEEAGENQIEQIRDLD